MNGHQKAHYQALIDNGVPDELAAAASLVTANESLENPRTTEQQQIVTEAWHQMNGHWQKEEENASTAHHP
ncbi:hypothetical protein [Nostoc sp.]|uniref:hypothetical protein n=1 Tax=Nostoc sp. TaxID=1180 RepID=UPI002FF8ED33